MTDPEDLDREIAAQVEKNQREFDEEMATRHRQRDTPVLRAVQSILGLRRRREHDGDTSP